MMLFSLKRISKAASYMMSRSIQFSLEPSRLKTGSQI